MDISRHFVQVNWNDYSTVDQNTIKRHTTHDGRRLKPRENGLRVNDDALATTGHDDIAYKYSYGGDGHAAVMQSL
jgi:hypothetical protein